jgi:hypothetical protein
MSSETASDCTTPNRPYLIGLNEDQRRAVLFRPRCKLWSCPYCAQVNQNLWAVRAFMGTRAYQEQGIEIDFLTLTPREDLTPAQSMWVFPRAWKKLSQRARRACDQFSYIMIPERFKDGRIHVHAIETGALGQTWWKKNARSSGLGYIQEEEPIRKPAGAAAYVVKYVAKSLEVLNWPARFHRVRTSRDWPQLPELVSPDGWRFVPIPITRPLDEVLVSYEGQGYSIRMLGSAAAWVWIDADPETGEVSRLE